MRDEGSLLVWCKDTGTLIDTGLLGWWDGEDFVVPFLDETTAEDVGRIVTGTVKRESESP